MYRCCAVVAALAGCGRLDFAPRGGDAATEIARDTTGDTASGAQPCPAGVLFCDGFETGTTSAWDNRYGALAIQSTTVHRGGFAAVATSDGSTTPAGVDVARYGTGIVDGSLHFRAWFYVPSGFALQKLNLFGTDGQNQSDGVTFIVDQEELRVFSAPGTGSTVTSGVTVPRDAWFCIEVDVDVAVNGAIRLDLDGVQIGQATGIATVPTGGHAVLGIGTLFLPPGQGATTIYIDDVATGTQPIGC